VEPGEALSTAAQVAVALAGFVGVVVVFRSGSVHEWSPIDKLRLRLLLSNSILPRPIMYDRTAADDQARTGRHLEVVQRIRFRDVFAVRRADDEHLSSFGSATDTA